MNTLKAGLVVLLLLPVMVLADTNEAGRIVIPRHAKDGDNTPQVVFSHAVHRIQFKCYACHDSIFKMQSGADNIDMDALSEGRFCAVCHDGDTAFAVGFDTCDRCHQSAEP